MKELLAAGIETLKKCQVDYGDIRIGRYRRQEIVARDLIPSHFSDDTSSGFGVRAFYNGYWGFSCSPDTSLDSITREAARAAEIARTSALMNGRKLTLTPTTVFECTWQTDYRIDPFSIPLQEKIDLLREINRQLLSVYGINQAVSTMNFAHEHKLFMSTIGTITDQSIMRAYAEYTATAVSEEKGFESRTFQVMPLNRGYEMVEDANLLADTRRISEEALEKLHSPNCPEDTLDLVLLPTHTALVIHETIGHATELDRVLGWEADFAGTSFATLDKLATFRYGSDLFSVTGDRTFPGGRATIAFDDDGVPTKKWYLVRNGILSGYATTRDTGSFIGADHSNGCSFADSWSSMPILRMPNVSIEPGPQGSPSSADIIAGTDHGLLIDGRGSYSIDHQRINFQFGGDYCRIIKNGRPGHVLRRVTYQSHNPLFWSSVDAIAPEAEWRQYGVTNCGKGQPMQTAQLTHGSAPLRVRNVRIGRARI